MNKLLISLLSLTGIGALGTGIAYSAGAFGESKPGFGGEGQPRCHHDSSDCSDGQENPIVAKPPQ